MSDPDWAALEGRLGDELTPLVAAGWCVTGEAVTDRGDGTHAPSVAQQLRRNGRVVEVELLDDDLLNVWLDPLAERDEPETAETADLREETAAAYFRQLGLLP